MSPWPVNTASIVVGAPSRKSCSAATTSSMPRSVRSPSPKPSGRRSVAKVMPFGSSLGSPARAARLRDGIGRGRQARGGRHGGNAGEARGLEECPAVVIHGSLPFVSCRRRRRRGLVRQSTPHIRTLLDRSARRRPPPVAGSAVPDKITFRSGGLARCPREDALDFGRLLASTAAGAQLGHDLDMFCRSSCDTPLGFPRPTGMEVSPCSRSSAVRSPPRSFCCCPFPPLPPTSHSSATISPTPPSSSKRRSRPRPARSPSRSRRCAARPTPPSSATTSAPACRSSGRSSRSRPTTAPTGCGWPRPSCSCGPATTASARSCSSARRPPPTSPISARATPPRRPRAWW